VEFFTGSNGMLHSASIGQLMEACDPEVLMKTHPDYYGPRFEAMAKERSVDDGSMKGCEFRKVASFTNVPLFEALRIQEGLLKGDKNEFYRFLNKYPQYRSYDRRGKDHPTETFVNGVPV
jgi:hypothetical protein